MRVCIKLGLYTAKLAFIKSWPRKLWDQDQLCLTTQCLMPSLARTCPHGTQPLSHSNLSHCYVGLCRSLLTTMLHEQFLLKGPSSSRTQVRPRQNPSGTPPSYRMWWCHTGHTISTGYFMTFSSCLMTLDFHPNLMESNPTWQCCYPILCQFLTTILTSHDRLRFYFICLKKSPHPTHCWSVGTPHAPANAYCWP